MTAITYNLGIPNPVNAPALDVPNMQINTNNIATFVGTDHVPFGSNLGDTANGGWHRVIHLPVVAKPGVQASPPAGQLYAKTVTGDTQLFYQTSGGSEYQITPSSAVIPSPSPATNGYAYLTGGILLQWGLVTTAFSGSSSKTGLVNFNAANINFPNNCYQVLLTLIGSSGHPDTLQITTTSKTQFTWTFTSVPNTTSYTGFYWYAVGN